MLFYKQQEKKFKKKIRAILHSNSHIYISTIHLMKNTKNRRLSLEAANTTYLAKFKTIAVQQAWLLFQY